MALPDPVALDPEARRYFAAAEDRLRDLEAAALEYAGRLKATIEERNALRGELRDALVKRGFDPLATLTKFDRQTGILAAVRTLTAAETSSLQEQKDAETGDAAAAAAAADAILP